MSNSPLLCFVDPLVSGKYLETSLNSIGLRFVIVSSFELKTTYQTETLNAATYYLHDYNGMALLAQHLKAIGVTHLLYGAGPTVVLADQLAKLVSPNYANSDKTSHYRSHKFYMQHALAMAGITGIKEVLFDPLHYEMDSLLQVGVPCVIKPAVAAGSFGVRLINDRNKLDEVVASLPKSNVFSSDQHYVIQERLTGVEYFVDAVSIQGQHHIVGIFEYEKEEVKGRPLYRHAESLIPYSPIWQLLEGYTKQVLNATEMHNGLSHTEIFLTPQGPRLVELNPRISGAHGLINQMSHLAYGTNQIDVLTSLVLNLPVRLPQHQGYAKLLCLRTHKKRAIRALNHNLVYSFASVVQCKLVKEAGEVVDSCDNLWSIVGFILLFNTDATQLTQDYQALLEAELKELLF